MLRVAGHRTKPAPALARAATARARHAHLCLAKAEVTQRREHFDSNLERPRRHAATVFSAVGMSDAQSTVFASIDDDLAALVSSRALRWRAFLSWDLVLATAPW